MDAPSIPSYAAFLTTFFRRGNRRDSIEVLTRTMLFVALVVSALPTFADTPTIDRSVAGIQLGMTLEEVRKAFQIEERKNGHIIFTRKFIRSDPEKRAQIIKNLETQVFALTGQLPEGASSIQLFFRKHLLYQIAFHYDKPYIQKVDWDVFTLPYIEKYGQPHISADLYGIHSFSYTWKDTHTRLEIDKGRTPSEDKNKFIPNFYNIFYTDIDAYETLKRDEEREMAR